MCRSSLSLLTLSSAGLISADASGTTLFVVVSEAQAHANVRQANDTPRKRMCFFIFVPFGYLFPVCGQTLRNRKSARKERRKYGALLMICRVRRQTFRPTKIGQSRRSAACDERDRTFARPLFHSPRIK